MPRKSSKSSKKSTSSSSKRSKTKSTSKKRKSKLFNKSDPLLLKLLKLLWHCFKWTMVKIGQLVAWVTKSLHKKAKQSHKTHKKNKQIKKQKEHLKAIQPQSPPQKIPLEEVEVLEGNLKKFESWFYKKINQICHRVNQQETYWFLLGCQNPLSYQTNRIALPLIRSGIFCESPGNPTFLTTLIHISGKCTENNRLAMDHIKCFTVIRMIRI